VGGREVLMTITPEALLESLARGFRAKDIWPALSTEEKESFKQFVWTKCEAAKKSKDFYAYLFFNRMAKRLIEGKVPIGEEWDETSPEA
jgi:hypothetical protein